MPQDQRPTASKRGWFLGAAALLLVGALGLVLRSTLAQTSPVPAWTHEYPGKGIIHSVTASKRRDGTEVVVAAGYAVTDTSGNNFRVVAYAADSGQILWEKRLAHNLKAADNKDPFFNPWPSKLIVSCDEDGSIHCGSEFSAFSKGLHHSLCKLSIEDGSELWQWSAESPGDRPSSVGRGHLAKAAATARGRVWVSGIWAGASGGYERFLALLDTADGRQRWFAALKAADGAYDHPAEVHPLAGSDAIVMSPRKGNELCSPWILQRVDETTGTANWQREFLLNSSESPRHIVDEANEQVLVFWDQVVRGVQQIEVLSVDLATGVERWSNHLGFLDSYIGALSGAGLDSSGNPVLFGKELWTTEEFHWLEWHYDPSIRLPVPKRMDKDHHRPISVTFSPMDGTVVSQSRLSNRNEIPRHLLYDPGTQQVRAVFVRQANLDVEFEPWRAIRLDATDPTPPKVGGPEAVLTYPLVSTLTPSGRIITAGDPKGESEVWRIELW